MNCTLHMHNKYFICCFMMVSLIHWMGGNPFLSVSPNVSSLSIWTVT